MLLASSINFGRIWSCQRNSNSYISSIHSFLQLNFGAFSTMSLFEGRSDHFNGVTIFSNKEPCTATELGDKLSKSLKNWTENEKRGIWFRVDLKQSDWVPILANNGFKFHHAKDDYVMMLKWLPKDEECNVPPYAHTLVGVGAVVVTDDKKLLVVSERYNKRPQWKLPGGYVEPGENLVDAAIREVFEETGIHSEFKNILSFRHGHGGQFDCSDIYTTVSLKPLSTNIKKCDREIAECKWMDVEEYLTHPDIHELNKFFVNKYLENKKHGLRIDCTHGMHQILKKPYTVYHAIGTEKLLVGEAKSEAKNKL